MEYFDKMEKFASWTKSKKTRPKTAKFGQNWTNENKEPRAALIVSTFRKAPRRCQIQIPINGSSQKLIKAKWDQRKLSVTKHALLNMKGVEKRFFASSQKKSHRGV